MITLAGRGTSFRLGMGISFGICRQGGTGFEVGPEVDKRQFGIQTKVRMTMTKTHCKNGVNLAFLYNPSPNGGLFCLAFHGFRVKAGFRVGFRVRVGIRVGFRVGL